MMTQGSGLSISVRAATADDVPALGRLGSLLVAVHHELDPARFIAPTPTTEHSYAAFLASQLERPEAILLVAEGGRAVLGYALARTEGSDFMVLRGPAALLHDLVVDPSHRRKGVARMLLDAVIAAARQRGAPRLVLSTAATNRAAQQLFASAGFRDTMIEMTHELE